jgi:hypothetical protein
MPQEERRKHPRANSLNLLSYHCLDENQEVVMQGVGRTLNVSQGGILLETHVPIGSQYTVSLFMAMGNDLIDVKGNVVHSSAGKDGKFNTGIKFTETDESTREILERCIEAFHDED